MKLSHPRRLSSLAILSIFTVILGGTDGLLGTCGPFIDVAADSFCPFVLEIFTLGITTGTTPTTYDPAGNVSRLQMAAFLSRSVDGILKRGSRRAALDRFWSPQDAAAVGVTTVGFIAFYPRSDGADIWVPNSGANTVSRVRASDGRLLETWTGATTAKAALSAMGRILVAGGEGPGFLYQIDPRQPAGAVTTVASSLFAGWRGLAFDGARVWVVGGSVSIVTPGPSLPWTVTTVTAGFSNVTGVLYDGGNIWVTDIDAGTLLKLDSNGAILQTVTTASGLLFPLFDGTNIWTLNTLSNSLTIVRPGTGSVLATLSGNGLAGPEHAAFDGQRILVTNANSDSVSLWKAADLSPIGNVTLAGSSPLGACSDGIHFWITSGNLLLRF